MPSDLGGGVRSALSAHGITPDTDRLDQHLLVDGEVLARLVGEAGVGPGDVVLDPGAGPGTIGAALAPQCRSVVAVEADDRFVPLLLAARRANPNLSVIVGDLHNVPLPQPDVVVGSPPFGLMEVLAARLLDLQPRRVVLITGAATAMEALADPTDPAFVRTTLFIQAAFSGRIVGTVAPSAFWPEPRRPCSLLVLDAQPRSELRRFARLVAFRGHVRVRDALATLGRTGALTGSIAQRRLSSLSRADLAALVQVVAETPEPG